MIKLRLNDGAGHNGDCHVHRREDRNGIIAFTDDLHLWTNNSSFASNPENGINMNVNGAFGGSPEVIHNGIDSVAWTASSITGGKFTFNSTDQAFAGTRSIKTDNGALNDTFQLDKGSDLDLSGYVALTMEIYVDKDWTTSDSIEIYGWDTATGLEVGSSVPLEDYFNEGDFDTWHKVTIPFADMGLTDATLDAFRVQIVAKAGKSPKYYIDEMQLEETGDPVTFKILPPSSSILRVSSLYFSFTDALDTTLLNSSMMNLSYDKILGVPKLANGIVISRIINDVPQFTASVTCLQEFMRITGQILNPICDGTNTSLTVKIEFDSPILLDSSKEDYISIQISDDLSGLLDFTTFSSGSTRLIHDEYI